MASSHFSRKASGKYRATRCANTSLSGRSLARRSDFASSLTWAMSVANSGEVRPPVQLPPVESLAQLTRFRERLEPEVDAALPREFVEHPGVHLHPLEFEGAAETELGVL